MQVETSAALLSRITASLSPLSILERRNLQVSDLFYGLISFFVVFWSLMLAFIYQVVNR